MWCPLWADRLPAGSRRSLVKTPRAVWGGRGGNGYRVLQGVECFCSRVLQGVEYFCSEKIAPPQNVSVPEFCKGSNVSVPEGTTKERRSGSSERQIQKCQTQKPTSCTTNNLPRCRSLRHRLFNVGLAARTIFLRKQSSTLKSQF